MSIFSVPLATLGSALALAGGTLAPVQHTATAGRYQWAALGDSYTAGVVSAAGHTFESPRDGCERTDQSYPRLIERSVPGLFALRDVSCGGAAIANVAYRPQTPIGRVMPGVPDPDGPFAAVPPQIEATGPGTDVITVGVGGNTFGATDIFARCVQLGATSKGKGAPCRNELAAGISARLARTGREYDQMLSVLHQRAPRAQILAVGYPAIIPTDTSKCRYGDLEQFGSITRGDLDWLRTSILTPLNQVIESSASTHAATHFVDLSESSGQHSVCDTDKWVEGILHRTGRTTDYAIWHPNTRGHRNAAVRLGRAMALAVTTHPYE